MREWRHDIAVRLAPLQLPPTREAEVVEELSQHLDERYAELRASGASDAAARRDVLAELDEGALIRGLMSVEGPRTEPLVLGGGARGIAGGVWQDLRFGARMLVKDAGASLVILITLGLAIAANAMVFGLADLILLRPLPIGNTTRLATVHGKDTEARDRSRLSIPEYLDVKAQCSICEDTLAMTRDQQMTLAGAGDPIAVSAAYATANLFHLWQVSPAIGRLMVRGEDAPGRDPVVVLAHHFWSAHFAADPAVVGRAILLNGRSYTVVGVVTPTIEIGNLAAVDVWVPLEISASAARDDRSNTVMALLKPGASLDAFNAELATISTRLSKAYPATNGDWHLFAISLRESTVGNSTMLLLALLGVVVGLVLVVACANVATVMLARASARRREIAVRVALGATRSRLIRQLISEGLLLGVASGSLGVLLAYGGLTAFKMLSPEAFFLRLAINTNLLAFSFGLSLVTPMLFGVLPALQSSRPNLHEDLKDGGRDAASAVRGSRSRSVLLVAQVAFALAVLLVSGLIVRAVVRVEHIELGVVPRGLLTVRMRLDPPKFPNDEARLSAVDALLDRLAIVPGVVSAGVARMIPVVDGEPTGRFTIAGQPMPAAKDAPSVALADVYGDYASAVGLTVLEGRTWRSDERARGRTFALVNREAARRYWTGGSAVGAHITMIDAQGGPAGGPLEIIGVVDNVVGDPTLPAPPRVYRSFAGRPMESLALVVRASGDSTAIAPAVRSALRAENGDLAMSDLRTFDEQVGNELRTFNLIMAMFAGFAAIGLLVAVTGIYGVTAFWVGQRRHEIGVRLALGATRVDVMRLIAGRTFRLIAIGATAGVFLGWAIGLGMRNLLFGVSAGDPATYVAVLAIVALCATAATYLPAHRALRIDPMAVLKRD
jgi:putative ABC transport system permease protein